MRPTFDIVAEIIALTCEVPRERITPDSNLVNDLRIDSLDLLDITFAIDDAFGIAMPIDQWLHAVHMGRISSDQVLRHEGILRQYRRPDRRRYSLTLQQGGLRVRPFHRPPGSTGTRRRPRAVGPRRIGCRLWRGIVLRPAFRAGHAWPGNGVAGWLCPARRAASGIPVCHSRSLPGGWGRPRVAAASVVAYAQVRSAHAP